MTDTLASIILLPSAILTLTVDTPFWDISRIAYVASGRLWVMDRSGRLIQVDTSENIIEEVESQRPYCVTSEGNLLYVTKTFDEDEDKDEYDIMCIKKKSLSSNFTLLKTEKLEAVRDIHSSFINGDILVLIEMRERSRRPYKITRYNEYGKKIQDIKKDDWWCIEYITENRNGDIVISAEYKVLGIDSSGEDRFSYSHPENEIPGDICTDTYGYILVDFSISIHILDQDGVFQRILRDIIDVSESTDFIASICLDEKSNLYVGTNRGIVQVFRYLKNE